MVHIHESRLHGLLELQIDHYSDGVLLQRPVEVVVFIALEGLVPDRLRLAPTFYLLVVLAESNAGVFVADEDIVYLTEAREVVMHSLALFDFFGVRAFEEQIFERFSTVIGENQEVLRDKGDASGYSEVRNN
jgi:hypothetical protein